ncbi:MAG TPA: hypothetical protein VJB35_00030 [Candidatus Nanoarchaeia archaeon]|nr:hypothetical protein [Candidatus Nanoarchaeia archaeon]
MTKNLLNIAEDCKTFKDLMKRAVQEKVSVTFLGSESLKGISMVPLLDQDDYTIFQNRETENLQYVRRDFETVVLGYNSKL